MILSAPSFEHGLQVQPTISLWPESFNALVAPQEMFAKALNRNLNLQRFKVLYICGNYSFILSQLDRILKRIRAIKGYIPVLRVT